MPSRVYLQLKDMNKPNIVKDGDSVEIDKDAGEVIIKNSLGEQIGWCDYSFLVAWWIEREPRDLANLTERELEYFIADVNKNGMVDSRVPATTAQKGMIEEHEA